MTAYKTTGAKEIGQSRVLLSNWQEAPLFQLSDDHMEHCEKHGDWCPNAYWNQWEISQMIADDDLLCPFCMDSICSR